MSSQGTADAVHRHQQLGLSDGEVLDMYKYMLLARKFDERCLLLQRAGKINFHVSGVGQEAAQVGAAFGLRSGSRLLFTLLPRLRLCTGGRHDSA